MRIFKILFSVLLFISSSVVIGQQRDPHIGYIYPAGGEQGTTVEVIIGGMNLLGVKDCSISGKGVTVESIKNFRPFNHLGNDAKRELHPILKAVSEHKDPLKASKKNTEKLLKKLKRQQEYKLKQKSKGDDGAVKAAVSKTKAGPLNKKRAKASKKNIFKPTLEEQLKVVPGERLVYINMTPEEVVEKIKALSPMEYDCFCKIIFGKKSVLQATPALDQIVIAKIKIAKDAEPGLRELRLYSKTGESNSLVFVVGTLPEELGEAFNFSSKNPVRDIKMPVVVNGQIMPGEVDRFRFNAVTGEHYSFEVLGRRLVPFLGDAVPGWFQPIISIHNKSGKMVAFADDNNFNPDPILEFSPEKDGDYELRIRDSIYRGREDFVYRIKIEEGSAPPVTQKKVELKYKLPESIETDAGNSLESAQQIVFPRLVKGRIDQPGDIDIFSFKAEKGMQVVAEIIARRVDSPVDSKIYLLNSSGEVLAWNDDFEWPNIGIKTHHADSYLSTKIPEEGTYYIKVGEAQNKGGVEYRYNLRIDKERPDFTVYADPSVLNIKGGMNFPITFNITRHDGFNGPVEIAIKKAPKGVKLSGQPFLEGMNKTRMTLFAPPNLKRGHYKIELEGKANINGREISHQVIPADDIMQAFLWRHIVPAIEMNMDIVRKGWTPLVAKIKEVVIHPGGKSEIVWANKAYKTKRIQKYILELDSPPKGLTVVDSKPQGKNYITTLALSKDAEEWSGNLIFKLIVEYSKANQKKKVRSEVGYLPAIPCTFTK